MSTTVTVAIYRIVITDPERNVGQIWTTSTGEVQQNVVNDELILCSTMNRNKMPAKCLCISFRFTPSTFADDIKIDVADGVVNRPLDN